jgi:uncharacterized protein (TIGR02001 family)
VTTAAGAQISGSATLVSDYRYRGITLSDQKPAAQLGVAYDAPFGGYAGAFVSTVRIGSPVVPGVQAMTFAGWATRLDSGISLDAGGAYSLFSRARAYDYGEFYLGAAREEQSARIYYSPKYFGGNAGAWYGELNGSQLLIDPVRLVAHVGLLSTRFATGYGSAPREHSVDGRIGFSVDVDAFHFELAWVGISNASATYRFAGNDSPNTVVLTFTRQF